MMIQKQQNYKIAEYPEITEYKNKNIGRIKNLTIPYFMASVDWSNMNMVVGGLKRADDNHFIMTPAMISTIVLGIISFILAILTLVFSVKLVMFNKQAKKCKDENNEEEALKKKKRKDRLIGGIVISTMLFVSAIIVFLTSLNNIL